MALYDYICKTCGKEQEMVHAMTREIETDPELQAEFKEGCDKDCRIEKNLGSSFVMKKKSGKADVRKLNYLK